MTRKPIFKEVPILKMRSEESCINKREDFWSIDHLVCDAVKPKLVFVINDTKIRTTKTSVINLIKQTLATNTILE